MNYLESSSDEDHTEREGADETSIETQWCNGCKGYVAVGTECDHPAVVKTAAVSQTLICSCGYKTCPLIVRFGLSVPTWTGVIQPIGSQMVRDTTALSIKSEGGL